MKIIKTTVVAKSRKLNANWTLDSLSELDIGNKVSKSVTPLTKDEEADLIISKLRKPPESRRNFLEEEISAILAKEISKSVDKEMLNALINDTKLKTL